jgi:CheY-like chemotaxis protein
MREDSTMSISTEQNHQANIVSNQGSEAEPSATTLEGITILLVEDEPDITYLLAFVLEELAGAVVTCVSSAAEALEFLDNCYPDILISDIRLPDADGLWLIQRIRAQGIGSNRLPAIAITSYSRDFNRHTTLEAGFQAFFYKPCEPDELTAEILRLTGRQT